MKKALLYSLSILVLASLWQLRAVQIQNPLIFPYLDTILTTLYTLLLDITTYEIILMSLLRLFVAFVLAMVIGISLGLIGGMYANFNHLLTPFVSGLRSLPVASLIVLFLMLYGPALAIYIIVFLMIFPIVYEASRRGVLSVDSAISQALRLEPLSPFKKTVLMYLPLAIPNIKSGAIQSIGLGFKVLVMAEFIGQAQSSIGRMIYLGRINLDYAFVIAWTIIIVLLVLGLEIIVHNIEDKT